MNRVILLPLALLAACTARVQTVPDEPVVIRPTPAPTPTPLPLPPGPREITLDEAVRIAMGYATSRGYAAEVHKAERERDTFEVKLKIQPPLKGKLELDIDRYGQIVKVDDDVREHDQGKHKGHDKHDDKDDDKHRGKGHGKGHDKDHGHGFAKHDD